MIHLFYLVCVLYPIPSFYTVFYTQSPFYTKSAVVHVLYPPPPTPSLTVLYLLQGHICLKNYNLPRSNTLQMLPEEFLEYDSLITTLLPYVNSCIRPLDCPPTEEDHDSDDFRGWNKL